MSDKKHPTIYPKKNKENWTNTLWSTAYGGVLRYLGKVYPIFNGRFISKCQNPITFSLALSKLRGKTPFFINCLERILDFFAGSNMELKIQFLEEEVKCWKKFMKLHYLDETKSCQIQTSTTLKQVKQSATKDLSSLSQSLCFQCCLIVRCWFLWNFQ